MGEYHVTGGRRLSGELRIGGGKNAVLPILASTVLNGGVSIIHDCPRISDTFTSMEILRAVGCAVEYQDGTMIVDSAGAGEYFVPENLVRKMRSSIIFLGGILGRMGLVIIGYPGGCELGERPIGLHIKALREMGAHITEGFGYIICETGPEGLTGTRVNLDFPSVGATENIMLAAVLAKGETIIKNAAREPEITDLQGFLNAMGARVRGAGSGTLVIQGVSSLDNAEYRIIPDRIVAGTYLAAAAMTGGEITLSNTVDEHIYPITARLEEAGCHIRREGDRVRLSTRGRLRPIDYLRTSTHPGFPTDMQPQMMALLCLADGTSIIEETIFESRNKHISELKRMGADIILTDGKTSVIKGVGGLGGAVVQASDLRAGAALILAGLVAEGDTVVTRSEHVERGYEDIAGDLRALGVNVVHLKDGEETVSRRDFAPALATQE